MHQIRSVQKPALVASPLYTLLATWCARPRGKRNQATLGKAKTSASEHRAERLIAAPATGAAAGSKSEQPEAALFDGTLHGSAPAAVGHFRAHARRRPV